MHICLHLYFILYIITICTSYTCIYVLCVRLTFVYHVFLMLYICILSYIQVVHVIIYLSIYIYIDCIYIYIYMLQDGPPQLYVGLKTIINPINYS